MQKNLQMSKKKCIFAADFTIEQQVGLHKHTALRHMARVFTKSEIFILLTAEEGSKHYGEYVELFNSLTEEQKARTLVLRDAYDHAEKVCAEREDYLMQNYFDCVDDYSWGGLCSQANNQAKAEDQKHCEFALEECLNGYVVLTDTFAYLADLEGNIVSTRIVSTKYGFCWVTEDGKFVSVPRKESTLTKKGYKSVIFEREYHCTIKGYSAKRNPIFGSIEVAKETPCDDLCLAHPYCGSKYVSWFYETHE